MPYISDFKFNDDNTVQVLRIDHNPKKITGGRFGAVLGEDKFKTPFGAWCEIVRVAERPYVETAETHAGEVIEPKISQYVDSKSRLHIVTPELVYGNDFKNTMNYNFFSDPIFGGMWDATLNDDAHRLAGVVEIKTTREKNRKWWTAYGAPDAYKRQVQLYAWLMGTPFYHIAVAFLGEDDIANPKAFECTDDNTMIFHERVPQDFAQTIETTRQWCTRHVYNGAVSPPYDEELDAPYLEILRKRVANGTNIKKEN